MRRKTTVSKVLFPGTAAWESAELTLSGVLSVHETADLSDGEVISVLPVSHLVSHPLRLLEGAEGDMVDETVKLHLETSGLSSSAGTFAAWRVRDGAMSVMAHVGHDLPHPRAERFEFSPRLYGNLLGDGIVLWKELGYLVTGFYQGGVCAHAQVLGARELDAGAVAELKTSAFALAQDGILSRFKQVVLVGLSTKDEVRDLLQAWADSMSAELTEQDARLQVPQDELPFVPPSIAARREKKERHKRTLAVVLAGGAI